MHLNPRIFYVLAAPSVAGQTSNFACVDLFCRALQNSALDVMKLQLSEAPTAWDHSQQQLRTVSFALQSPLNKPDIAAVNLAAAIEYLQVMRPDVLMCNQLDESTAILIMAGHQLQIPVILDATAEADPADLVHSALAGVLLKKCTQVWVSSAKHRQTLIQHKVPAAHLHAIPVQWHARQIVYTAASTALVWQILRLRYGATPVAWPDVAQVRDRQLRIVAIMDEFTRGCYEPEAHLLHLQPEDIVAQLEAFQPQLFFIESAWKGLNDSWKLKISNRAAELMLAIAWCRLHQVPVIFWNKEDPVHFSTFLPVAAAADFVFTTDVDCVPRYKAALGHQQVSLLAFAAQTRQHNPLELFERKDAFNFAGSYYLRYPERQRDFAALIDTVCQFRPVEIYDRNHENPHPHYEFPAQYRPMILGSLPFEQIDKAYKGYRYGINMNTIKQSQTMFARRVFELLACNTVVVSNFSRGVRTLFGDLVICSDHAAQLQQRLAAVCHSDSSYRKYRLQGLRKVMLQHTYRHRLSYICQQVFGLAQLARKRQVIVVAVVQSEADITAVTGAFNRQRHSDKQLILLTLPGLTPTVPVPGKVFTDPAQLQQCIQTAGGEFCAFFYPQDYYGPDYLTDSVLATEYSAGAAIGKASFFQAQNGELFNPEQQYRYVEQLALRRAMLPLSVALTGWIAQFCQVPADAAITGTALLSIDEFSYCADIRMAKDAKALIALVNADDVKFTGTDLDTQLLPQAAQQPAVNHENLLLGVDDNPFLKVLTAAQLKTLLPARIGAKLKVQAAADRLHVVANLSADEHAYLYFNKKFSRDALNLLTNSQFQLVAENCQGDVRTVFEYWSVDDKKLAHSINRDVGGKHTLAIPAHCKTVRFGLRLQGQCQLDLQQLVLGAVPEMPAAIFGAHRNLVLTKQYPAYDDLYRYGFLHSRIRAYREQGIGADIFRLGKAKDIGYAEFENIDVVSGPETLLDATLATGQYQHVLVHFLDQRMWSVLKKHLANLKVTVWVHGAEIQVWQRREYEFERMPVQEIIRQKKLSDQRVKLWREVLQTNNLNLQFVFVSQYFAEESFTDIGVRLEQSRYHIIHNYIDSELFRYQPKPVEQRLKLLSIRPYASRKYANDLTVAAIMRLSTMDFFPQLEICLVGDGDLFDELTAPLREFANVRLVKRFMNHAEIAALHRQYGVFLTPTRMDSQGVSRDEAMASGLVPITTAVAAIPEFVDNTCGFVAPAEDASAMADAIAQLYNNPALFSQLSGAAAARVRMQSGYEQTIAMEGQLIRQDKH